MQHIIVVGAGLAGLCAARELAGAGKTVSVIDARERIGGRVWTARDFAHGLYGELGGEFVDEGHREIRELATSFGLELVRVLRGGFTHRYKGDDGEWHAKRTRPWSEFEEVLQPLIRRYKAAGGDPQSDAVREMSTISFREWLRTQNASGALHSMADAVRGFFLADPDELSVLPVVEQIASGGSPAQTPIYRIAGGSDRLIAALAQSIPTGVRLRHTLLAISHATDRVVAHIEDDQGHLLDVEADAMVLAIPASTLRDVQIDPPLADEQAHAFEMLQYGRATKALLHTAGDLFDERARAFATDGAAGAFWDASPDESSAEAGSAMVRGHVTAFLAGGSASGQLHELVQTGGHSLLREVCWLPGAATNALSARWWTWEDDPWAQGGYAFLDPGFDPAWRALLSKRAGRLVFAGEHTSERWQGYMNGAVESGIRAAREILAL